MNLDKINQWLLLLTNLGVLVGIIFVGIEIQQNTRAIERDVQVSEVEAVSRIFVESEYLPRIQSQINEVQGNPESVSELASTFNLTIEDATRWQRYLTQIWQQNESNWRISSDPESICRYGRALLNFLDNQIYWKYSSRRFDDTFVQCVEEAENPDRFRNGSEIQ